MDTATGASPRQLARIAGALYLINIVGGAFDRHRLMNRRIFQYGAWLADEARAHGLPVVEALPFESLLDRARAARLWH